MTHFVIQLVQVLPHEELLLFQVLDFASSPAPFHYYAYRIPNLPHFTNMPTEPNLTPSPNYPSN